MNAEDPSSVLRGELREIAEQDLVALREKFDRLHGVAQEHAIAAPTRTAERTAAHLGEICEQVASLIYRVNFLVAVDFERR